MEVTEFEAKFLKINPLKLRDKLKSIGYLNTKPDTLMTRIALHRPDYATRTTHEWWRVRDEGNGHTTMTYKRTDADTLSGTKEIEISVSDFASAVALLKSTGLEQSAIQESRREIWERDNVMICLDVWPGLSPFVEIEGPSEDSVHSAARDLGFDPADAVFGAVGNIYEIELGYPPAEVNLWPEIRFNNPPQPRRAA